MNTSIFESFAADQISNASVVTGGKGGNGRAHPPTSQDIGQNSNPGQSNNNKNNNNNNNNNNNTNNTNRPGNEG